MVCAIHGACAGGGYELALACHWRLASAAAVTQIGLPEIGLGTIPGWGGSVRLPRLIGAAPALDHILRAKLLPASEALTTGLVDEVVPVAQLKERAKAVALRLAGAGGRPVRSSPPVPDPGFFAELRRITLKKLRQLQPAPPAVIDVVDTDDGAILHVIEGALEPGPARGAIDWGRRFEHMQQHTGQHVLSAAFDRVGGARTESFHLGSVSATIEIGRAHV